MSSRQQRKKIEALGKKGSGDYRRFKQRGLIV